MFRPQSLQGSRRSSADRYSVDGEAARETAPNDCLELLGTYVMERINELLPLVLTPMVSLEEWWTH